LKNENAGVEMESDGSNCMGEKCRTNLAFCENFVHVLSLAMQ